MPDAPAKIPETHAPILESKALLYLATVNKDGSPQVSPVWFDTEGALIRVNSAKGRLKDRNMRDRTKVSLALVDPKQPFCWLGIQGTVVDVTEEGAEEHIDALAKKYLDVDSYPNRQPGQVRMLYRIRPDRVFTMGTPPAFK